MEKLTMAIDNVRPSVYLHAKKMESRLREKDKEKGRDGWHDERLLYYAARTMGCLSRVIDFIKKEKQFSSLEAINIKKIEELKEKEIHSAIKKCIDGSNFFMMLADNLRDELVKRGIPQNGKIRK